MMEKEPDLVEHDSCLLVLEVLVVLCALWLLSWGWSALVRFAMRSTNVLAGLALALALCPAGLDAAELMSPSAESVGTHFPLEVRSTPGDKVRDAAWISLAGAADFASTQYALASCAKCYEANPLSQTSGSRVAIKLGSAAATVVICDQLRKRGHPNGAKWFRWGVVAIWSGVAVHNMHQAKVGGKR